MGAVYKAKDANLNVEVAVKENLFTTEEYARQFYKEATILASLRHPNLPRVTDHFVITGQGQYLVMDFIQGRDLRERIESEGAIEESEALPWFMETCDALAYLHGRKPYPILHRDIKPGNIKIQPDGRAVLVDFGLAKVADDSGTTTTGAKAMTPGFSPPEQYGTGRTDFRTDVYSLGATMYAALTADVPEDSLERAMGREELTLLRRRNPRISAGLARAIEKALAVRPEERYQTISEFAAALSSASRASRPTLVRDYPYIERTIEAPITAGFADLPTRLPWEEKKRRRWPIVAIPILLVSAIAAGAMLAGPGFPSGIFGNDPTETPRPTPEPEPTEVAVVLPQPTPTIVLPSATPLPTVDPSITLTPAPTPIGGGIGQIAFASDRDGVPQIFLINVDGTDLNPLTNLPDGACQPSWSPDGMALVFTSPCPGSQETYPGAGLWVLDLENLQPQPLVTAPGGDYDPVWSPEGERIAFATERLGRPQVFVMRVDGSVVENVSVNTFREIQPVWSSQGTALLFVSYRNGFAQVWLSSDKGENQQRFARGDLEDSHPLWSHDGQLVVFQRRISGVPRLVAAQFEDRGVPDFRVCQQSPYTSHPMVEPDFSPDDRWLVVETWPDGVNHDIVILTVTCSSVTSLTDDAALDFDPAWRP
jgi:serine/threonine protein kinase/Tol biopolymer transport system component